MIDKYESMKTVIDVLQGESNFTVRNEKEFNLVFDHIINLIKDAYILYENESFSSSVFFSIAIIEEVAKLHMGMFIRKSNKYVKKDKLRDHKTKEKIGVNYTISLGKRLNEAIEKEEIEKIYKLAYSGELKLLREKSIYSERNNEITIPQNVINKKFARSLLLFAIESFDDNLVGYTEYTIIKSKIVDEIFETVSKIL